MHANVKLELDKTSALELPAFEPEEIDFWLNMAIRRFVKTRYSGVNIKKESFEETQKRIDDLRTLVEHVALYMIENDNATLVGPYALTTTPLENSYVLLTPVNSWPSDYWFALSEECEIAPTGGSTSRQGVTECTMDEYRQRIDDPFSEHKLHYGVAKPLRIFNANSVELVTDGDYSINRYYLTYLRVPATVNNVPAGTTDCDLPEHTHDEIVKMAASMMLENIEQPRYQTHMNEVNTME